MKKQSSKAEVRQSSVSSQQKEAIMKLAHATADKILMLFLSEKEMAEFSSPEQKIEALKYVISKSEGILSEERMTKMQKVLKLLEENHLEQPKGE